MGGVIFSGRTDANITFSVNQLILVELVTFCIISPAHTTRSAVVASRDSFVFQYQCVLCLLYVIVRLRLTACWRLHVNLQMFCFRFSQLPEQVFLLITLTQLDLAVLTCRKNQICKCFVFGFATARAGFPPYYTDTT